MQRCMWRIVYASAGRAWCLVGDRTACLEDSWKESFALDHVHAFCSSHLQGNHASETRMFTFTRWCTWLDMLGRLVVTRETARGSQTPQHGVGTTDSRETWMHDLWAQRAKTACSCRWTGGPWETRLRRTKTQVETQQERPSEWTACLCASPAPRGPRRQQERRTGMPDAIARQAETVRQAVTTGASVVACWQREHLPSYGTRRGEMTGERAHIKRGAV